MRIVILKYIVLFGFFAFLVVSLKVYFNLEIRAKQEVVDFKQDLIRLKTKVTQSNLNLHEHYIHAQSTDSQNILTPLDESKEFIEKMKSNAQNINNTIYNEYLSKIEKTLNLQYILSVKILSNSDTLSNHTQFESDYNHAYRLVLMHIDAFSKALDYQMDDIKYGQHHTRNGLFFFTSILGFIVFIMLIYSDRKSLSSNKNYKNQKSEMAQILNTAPIGIFHFDKNYIITDCNPKFAEIIGVNAEQLIGFNMEKDILDVKLYEAMKDSNKTGRGYYKDVYHSVMADKSTPVEVEFRPLMNKKGEYYSGIGLVRDLSEESATKEELKTSEEKFRSISDMAHDMIIIMDNKGLIEYWNKAAENVLGYSAEEAIGKHLHDMLAPQRYMEAHNKAFGHWRKTGEGGAIGKTVELEAIHKEGHEITIELSLSSILMNDEWHAVGIIRDVSERKKYEQELIEAKERAQESDRLKTAFLSNISHEIRTPMNGIIGFADLLKDPNVSGDQLRYFIDIIENSSKRMLNVINDIIVISKIETGDVHCVKSQIKVEEVINDQIQEFKTEAEEKDLKFSFSSHLDKAYSSLTTDYEKLHHVLGILMNNAIKFTHKGEIECKLEHKDGMIHISVRDTGIGIPKDKQDIIFDRFVQADNSKHRAYDGAGLGLSICKAYAKVLGGNLTLSSEEGIGSTFTLSLPQDAKIVEEEEKVEEKMGSKKTTILVAEDEFPSFILLQEYLSYLDAEIIHAEDGLEAVSYVKNNPVDLILMDLKMPNMDGYKAITLIKKEFPDIPIIAQTAYAMTGDEEKAIEIGSDDYIRKPINDKILKVKIRRYLKK